MQTGRTVDLEAVVERASAVGARILLDVTQATPFVPLAPFIDRVDYVVAAAYKHLLCPRGVAFLVVRPDRLAGLGPLEANWRAATEPYGRYFGGPLTLPDDARRLDVSLAWLPWIGAVESLRLLVEWAPTGAFESALDLARQLAARLGVEWGGASLVCAPIGDADAVREALRAAGVKAAVRGTAIRCATHVYTTAEEIDRAATRDRALPARLRRSGDQGLQNPLIPSAIGRAAEPSAGRLVSRVRPPSSTRGRRSDEPSGAQRRWLRAYWSKYGRSSPTKCSPSRTDAVGPDRAAGHVDEDEVDHRGRRSAGVGGAVTAAWAPPGRAAASSRPALVRRSDRRIRRPAGPRWSARPATRRTRRPRRRAGSGSTPVPGSSSRSGPSGNVGAPGTAVIAAIVATLSPVGSKTKAAGPATGRRCSLDPSRAATTSSAGPGRRGDRRGSVRPCWRWRSGSRRRPGSRARPRPRPGPPRRRTPRTRSRRGAAAGPIPPRRSRAARPGGPPPRARCRRAARSRRPARAGARSRSGRWPGRRRSDRPASRTGRRAGSRRCGR